MSLDPDIDADIPALIGASAALSLAGVPFAGPIGAARVGYKDGKYLLNPTRKELEGLAAATSSSPAPRSRVLMVESEADGLSEEVMLGAVVFGHEQMQVAIKAINELVAAAGKPKWDWKPTPPDAELDAAVAAQRRSALSDAYRITEKQDALRARSSEIKAAAIARAVAAAMAAEVHRRQTSTTSCSSSRATSSASASSTASRASTAAMRRPCARSP